MAWELHRSEGFPAIAASNIAPKIPVKLSPSIARGVVPLASPSEEPFGVSDNGPTATQGFGVTIHEAKSVVKVVAVASLGLHANIAIGSVNGALGPVAAASGTANYRVGIALSAAAAGETFSLYVSPKQLGGLA